MPALLSYWAGPPPARTLEDDKPTLLVSWWCTGFAVTVIVFRIGGRFVRIEHLFREDKIMALALIPLALRMAVVHVVLLWGTNNAVTTGLSRKQIHHREIGSRLVLLSRILYAAILWIEKYSIAETLYRLLSHSWRSAYERAVRALRWFLLVTFVAVVLSTIVECRPLPRSWQVVPDPGPKCRLAYGQLMTMGAANVLTDLLLVGLPIPIILRSTMTVRRKISLVLLFALSLAPAAVTLYRIPTLMDRAGSQQYRTLCASFEILVATAASNALALGSYVRDRGPKKKKFKLSSGSDSLSRPSIRRDGRTLHWDSDEDLVRSLGVGFDPEPAFASTDGAGASKSRPDPILVPGARTHAASHREPAWRFPSPPPELNRDLDARNRHRYGGASSPEGSIVTPRRVAFFDVGGLLSNDKHEARPGTSVTPIIDLYADSCSDVMTDGGSVGAGPASRAGSHVFLQDMGGLVVPRTTAQPAVPRVLISSPPTDLDWPIPEPQPIPAARSS
ncbi:MAG: hypothetical protein M1826_002139 [Phylliscum demangeonii]|nr:MAG: hypothetical protein M1826_002139 [Phylliscum demangeonii]